MRSPPVAAIALFKADSARYQRWVPKPCPAIFLDRDGTIIEEREYLSDPDGVRLIAGVGQALRRLSEAGFKLVVVTNQAGIGRGYFSESDMHAVNQRLAEVLQPFRVTFERIYFAPEAPDQPSRGRKPSPQFLFDARDEFGIALERSFMVGDKRSDLECGWNAGVRQSILVRTGYGCEVERELGTAAHRAVVVDDMGAAAEWILQSTSTVS